MGELRYLNEEARDWCQSHGHPLRLVPPLDSGLELAPAPSEVVETTSIPESAPETEISPADWIVIEKVARDPDLVACVELQMLGYTEVDIPDGRLEAIEEVGFPGVKEGILQSTNVGEGNFAVALAVCEQTIREERELYRQPVHNW